MNQANQNSVPTGRVRKLSETVREMKNAAADREDVVVEMREASRTRLEILAQELEPVFADVPEDDPAFDFVISSGEQPRLWIDAVAHITMGRDRRTYRFLRDTRLGRVVLAQSVEVKPVADQVTRYIAERLVERQRFVEGEVEPLPRGREEGTQGPQDLSRSLWKALFGGFLLVLAGAVVGVVSMLILLADRFPELQQYLQP